MLDHRLEFLDWMLDSRYWYYLSLQVQKHPSVPMKTATDPVRDQILVERSPVYRMRQACPKSQ
jgi:hypothetical protein